VPAIGCFRATAQAVSPNHLVYLAHLPYLRPLAAREPHQANQSTVPTGVRSSVRAATLRRRLLKLLLRYRWEQNPSRSQETVQLTCEVGTALSLAASLGAAVWDVEIRTYLQTYWVSGYTRGCMPVLAPSRHSPELMKDADKGHNAAARHGAAWARNAKWHSGVAPTTDQATAAILGSLSSPSCGALEIRTGERPDEGTSIPGRFPEGSRDSGNIRILGQRQPTTQYSSHGDASRGERGREEGRCRW